MKDLLLNIRIANIAQQVSGRFCSYNVRVQEFLSKQTFIPQYKDIGVV